MHLEKKYRILILGAASVHAKLINAAKELGCYTIVTDNVPYEKSTGKQIADEYWDNNIYDIEGIVERARACGVSAVISGWLDPCQRPYQEICERLNLPCYGTKEQFFKMTDKHAFKQMCVNNGVDVIPEYGETDLGSVEFPVFVKPVDSRGSRGQAVCYTIDELITAIPNAKAESSNGDIIIEKYMKSAHEFQVTYFFVNGEPYLLRTCDSYCGEETHHLEKVVACAVSPSRFTENYLASSHNKVVRMFKKLGIKNGPIFMQGFEDNGVFRFFDPGLRFPGVEYERIYSSVFGIDLMKAMVLIALGKDLEELAITSEGVWLKGKRAAILFPTIKAGTVGKIIDEELKNIQGVVSYAPRCQVGSNVGWTYNVNQRSAEIDLVSDNTESLRKLICKVQDNFKVFDDHNSEMTFEVFDTSRIS